MLICSEMQRSWRQEEEGEVEAVEKVRFQLSGKKKMLEDYIIILVVKVILKDLVYIIFFSDL